MSTDTERQVELLIRARYPIIFIVSWEEPRVIEALRRIGDRTSKQVYEWSCSAGIIDAGTSVQVTKGRKASTRDPLNALDEVVAQVEPAVYVFKDFHPFLTKTNHAVIRKLRDLANELKSSYKTLVLISPFLEIPAELEKDITVIDFPLPTMEELGGLLDRIVEDVKGNENITLELSSAGREQILKAARGLTLNEAENVLAKVLVTNRRLSNKDVPTIFAEKRQIIRKSGLLDYHEPALGLEHVGGLDNLKEWLARRKLAFADKARRFGLPHPRGVLLLGIQGCGKSMCAKAVSALWQLPLLRFDMGRMFSSLVGSSEENIRRAISVAEGVAPSILWVDEIDKAFGALSGTSSDSGTSQRVLGTFLTWLAEKTTAVFVVATANNINVLPPELLRKGRFDEIFFVDLPSFEERKEIFGIHLKLRSRQPAKFDLEKLGLRSNGYSGAEIEQVVVSALFEAYYQRRDVADQDLIKAIDETVPLSRTMEEEIKALREWCTTRTRHASTPPEEVTLRSRRSLEFAD